MRLHSDWDEEIWNGAANHTVKAGLNDTYDGEWAPIDQKTLIDYGGIGGESLLPVAVAQNCDRRSATTRAVLGDQEPPDGGLHTKERKVISADQFTVSQARRVSPLDSNLGGKHGEHSRKNGVLVAKIAIHRIGKVLLHIAAVGTRVTCVGACVLQHHEPVGLNHRQALQKNLIDQRKYCGVRADSERQSDDRGHGETRGASELAQSVAEVLEQSGHRDPIRTAMPQRD